MILVLRVHDSSVIVFSLLYYYNCYLIVGRQYFAITANQNHGYDYCNVKFIRIIARP